MPVRALCRARRTAAAGIVWWGLVSLGCQTPTQGVPIRVEPGDAAIFVDGEPLSAIPGEVVLRSDRAHVLLIKREGYRAERVILNAIESNGVTRLDPDRVSVRLSPIVPTERAIRIEQEQE